MTIIKSISRFVNNKRDGTYWLNMSWKHDQTLIHMRPVFGTVIVPTDPPPPVEDNKQLALALAIGLALLLFILAALLLLCCLCRGCPLYEYRKRRRKRGEPVKKEPFTAPLFRGVAPEKGATPHANGATAPLMMTPIRKMSKSALKLESSAVKQPSPRPSMVSSNVMSTPTSSIMGNSGHSHNAISEFGNLPAVHRSTAGTITRGTSRRGTNWDIQTMRKEVTGGLAEATIESCIVSADSRLLITGNQSGSPCVWDLMTGSLLRIMHGTEGNVTELILGADDQAVVGCVSEHGHRGPVMKMWDFSSCENLETPYPVIVSAMCLMGSETQLLVCQTDHVAEAVPALVVWDLIGNDVMRRIPFNQPHGMHKYSGFSFLDVTSDDRFALAGFIGGDDARSSYAVFDLFATGVQITPQIVAYNSRLDTSVVLKGGTEAVTGMRSGRLVVWNMLTSLPSRQLLSGESSIAPHAADITHLVLSKDGSLLVSGDSQGIVKFWRIANEFNTAAINVPQLSCIVVSRDGYLTATGSSNGRISLWRAHGSQPVAELVTRTDITDLLLTPDLSAVVALNSDHHAMILRLQRDSSGHYATTTRL